jgi:hypothetical protein
VVNLNYFETTATNPNCIHEEIEHRVLRKIFGPKVEELV